MNSHARGDTRISIYVNDISEPEVERLAEAVADVLRDHGFGNREGFRSVIAAEAWDWPASDPEAFVEEMNVAGGFFVLPDPGDED